VGEGTTQQCIFHVAADSQYMLDEIDINAIKTGAGADPELIIKTWVYSAVTGSVYEVAREAIDVAVANTVPLQLPNPLIIGEKSHIYLEGTSDTADAEVNCRFTGILFNDVDAS